MDTNIIETPTRLRSRTEIQTTRCGHRMMRAKQLGNGPRSCEEFAEHIWRMKLQSVASTSTVSPDERESPLPILLDSVHMMAKMDLPWKNWKQSMCLDFPTTAITVNGSTDTTEEAKVYVKDLEMFLTVQLLKDPPVVLYLGKLCEENGYPYEWKEGQTPNITENGKIVLSSAITSGLSSFLVVQVKHTFRQKIQLKAPRS